MPLQNRVDPRGRIVADPGRGTMTGNRGILHDEAGRIVRNHASPAWINCVLSWPGVRRQVMTRRTWTELFFLDEATALAAGHRPCAYCRRGAYNSFVEAWSNGNPLLAPTGRRRAPIIDRVLHRERRASDGSKATTWLAADDLPTATMVVLDRQPHLIVGRAEAAPWSFGGYGRSLQLPAGSIEVLTPPSTVGALVCGYAPDIHPSASL